MKTKEEGTVTMSIERFNQLIKKEESLDKGLVYTETIFYDCLVKNDYVVANPDDLNKKLIDINSSLESELIDIRKKIFWLSSDIESMSFFDFIFNRKNILHKIDNLMSKK